MLKITELAKRFGLSRSTLLYYDRIELLRPPGRSESGYRLYAPADVERLQSICAYREAGLSLEEISEILNRVDAPQRQLMEGRLEEIGRSIRALQQQQQLLAGMLKVKAQSGPFTATGKELWVEMLRNAGMDDAAMWRWHHEFELRAPQDHQTFLIALGIDDEEVRSIRERSAGAESGEEAP